VVCGGRVCRRRENFDLRTVARLEDFVSVNTSREHCYSMPL